MGYDDVVGKSLYLPRPLIAFGRLVAEGPTVTRPVLKQRGQTLQQFVGATLLVSGLDLLSESENVEEGNDRGLDPGLAVRCGVSSTFVWLSHGAKDTVAERAHPAGAITLAPPGPAGLRGPWGCYATAMRST